LGNSGKLHPGASSLAPCLSLQLRAIEKSGLERRLAALEKWLAAEKAEQALADEAETSGDGKAI